MRMADGPDTVWLSYAELAEARGVDLRSAIRTVRNRRWPKRKGNDGKIRAEIPTEFLEAKKHHSPEIRSEIPTEITSEMASLRTKVEMLTQQVQHERAQREAAEAQITDLKLAEAVARTRAEGAEA